MGTGGIGKPPVSSYMFSGKEGVGYEWDREATGL